MSLSEQFATSVKTIFQILDAKGTKLVWLRDLESKWRSQSIPCLSKDVIGCLHSVANLDGSLTFEQFLEGLSRSLNLRQDHAPPKPTKPIGLKHRAISVTQLHPDHDHYIRHGFRPLKASESSEVFSQSSDDLTKPVPQHLNAAIPEADVYKRSIPKRRESTRRHTLGHGVDSSTLRRSKMYEEERKMLLTGLQTVDKAREWYSRRLQEVGERLRLTSDGSNNACLIPSDSQSLDKHEERVNLEKVRINELNQQVLALTQPGSKGGLLHLNLARSASTSQAGRETQHANQLLRTQNRMLTKEVSQKSDRISQLEKDKALLLRDLFEVRSRGYGSNPPSKPYNESTLM